MENLLLQTKETSNQFDQVTLFTPINSFYTKKGAMEVPHFYSFSWGHIMGFTEAEAAHVLISVNLQEVLRPNSLN